MAIGDRGSPSGGHHIHGDSHGDPLDAAKENVRRWMVAAKIGRLGELSALLAQHPALLNAKDSGLGNTALHWAAAKNNTKIVKFLCDSGADTNLPNASGDTPMDSALKNSASHGVTAALARARSPTARLESPTSRGQRMSPRSPPSPQSPAGGREPPPYQPPASQDRPTATGSPPPGGRWQPEIEEGLPPAAFRADLSPEMSSPANPADSSDFASPIETVTTSPEPQPEAVLEPVPPPPVPEAALSQRPRSVTTPVPHHQLPDYKAAEVLSMSTAADSQRLRSAKTRRRRGSVELLPSPIQGSADEWLGDDPADAEATKKQLEELVLLEQGFRAKPKAPSSKGGATDRAPAEKPRNTQLRSKCATLIASRMRGRKERRDYLMMRKVSRTLQGSLRDKWISQLSNDSGSPGANRSTPRSIAGRALKLGDPSHLTNGRHPADYGKVNFPTTVGGGVRTQPFVRVDDKCPGEKLAAMMMYHWRFGTKKLRVMISVVGSSFDDVDLPVSTQSAVSRGLTAFARNVSAIVVSSGLDQGVSKLIGKCARECAREALSESDSIPFVGIAAWDAVMGNRTLRANALGASDTQVVEYDPDSGGTENADVAAPLEEYHSHFIFVDSRSQGGKWYNSEKPVCSKVESSFVKLRKIPLMVFVIGGGVGTLHTVSQALKASNPVVVVEGSGGIADAIASIISSGSFARCNDTLLELLPEQGQVQEVKRLKAELQQGVKERLITVFNASMIEKGIGVEEVMMKSMLMRLQFKPLKKLTLAIQWGQTDVVEHLIAGFKHERRLYKALLDFCLRKAIFCRRAEIAETMLMRGSEVDRQYGTTMEHGLRLTVRELYGLGGQFPIAQDIQKKILKLRDDEVTMRTQESILGISQDLGEVSVTTATAVKLGGGRWLAKARKSKAEAEERAKKLQPDSKKSELEDATKSSVAQASNTTDKRAPGGRSGRRGSVDRILAIGQSIGQSSFEALMGAGNDEEVEEIEPEAVSKGWQCALCTQTSYGGDWKCQHNCPGTRGLDTSAPANCTLVCYMKPVEWLTSPYTKHTIKSPGAATEGSLDSPHVRHEAQTRRNAPNPRRRRGGRQRQRDITSSKTDAANGPDSSGPRLNDVDHLEYPQPVIDALKEFMPQFDPNYVKCETRPMTGAIDIMLWACFNNDAALAEIFWRRCKAPVEAGLVGSVLCKNLSEESGMDPSTAKGLVDLAQKLEHLAKEVLSSCASMQDAEKILRRKSELWGVTTMELALDDRNTAGVDASTLATGGPSSFLGGSAEEEDDDDEDWQETFLAHRYCGPVLNAVWCGDYLQNNEDSLMAYLKILLQLVVPFRQIVETHGGQEQWEYSKFLRVPKVKFIVYYAAYIGFLTVYVLVLANRRISWLDLVLTVWVFGLSLNEALDYRGSGGTHFDDFWNIIDAVFLGLIHIAMCMRCTVVTGLGVLAPCYLLLTGSLLAAEAPTLRSVLKFGSMPNLLSMFAVGAYMLGTPVSELVVPPAETLQMLETVSFKLLSCNVILAFVRLFTVLMASGPTGVLTIIIVRMCNEKTSAFMIMITALGCSFAVALAGLELLGKSPSAEAAEPLSITGFVRATGENLVQLVWALVGDLETSEEEQSEWTSQAMLWVYMLVVQLLLANGVLIALLTDTYEAVRDRAYGEQVLSRLDLLHEFVAKHWLPPPLTLPFVAAEHLGWGEGSKEGTTLFAFQQYVKSVTTRKLDVELEEIDPRLKSSQKAAGGLPGIGGGLSLNTSGSMQAAGSGAPADALESQALTRFLRGCAPVTQGGRDDEDASVETKLEQLTNQIGAIQEQLGALASRLPGGAGAAAAIGDGGQ